MAQGTVPALPRAHGIHGKHGLRNGQCVCVALYRHCREPMASIEAWAKKWIMCVVVT